MKKTKAKKTPSQKENKKAVEIQVGNEESQTYSNANKPLTFIVVVLISMALDFFVARWKINDTTSNTNTNHASFSGNTVNLGFGGFNIGIS